MEGGSEGGRKATDASQHTVKHDVPLVLARTHALTRAVAAKVIVLAQSSAGRRGWRLPLLTTPATKWWTWWSKQNARG